MNAYELADELNQIDEVEYDDLITIEFAVKVLRQQADKIAELEHDLKSLAKRYKALTWNDKQTKPEDTWTSCLDCGQRVTGDSIHTCSPQTKQGEPVAWATEDLEDIMSSELRQAHIDHPESCTHKFFPIPLYTTPQTKPLSDEEIDWFIDDIVDAIGLNNDCMEEEWYARGRNVVKAVLERHGIK